MKKLLITFLLTAFSFHAFAAGSSGTAVFKSDQDGVSSTLEFEYLDTSTSRMNVETEQGGESYMLFKDGKALIVANTQGQTLVMDMANLSQAATNLGVSPGDYAESFTTEVKSMKPTGRSETVAGIKGEIYDFRWVENGAERQDELVLSRDAKALDYTQAWMGAIQTMQKTASQKALKGDQLVTMLDKEKLGILRLGDQFQLVSLDTSAPDAARFDPPAATMEMPNLGSIFGGTAAAQEKAPTGDNTGETSNEQAQSSSGGLLGGLMDKFNQKSERQANRQINRTDHAVNRTTDRAVDSAVNKVMNSLFK